MPICSDGHKKTQRELMQELSTERFNVLEFQPVLMSGMKRIISTIYINVDFFQHPPPAPTFYRSSFTTSFNLSCGLSLVLFPGSYIFNILCPICPLPLPAHNQT